MGSVKYNSFTGFFWPIRRGPSVPAHRAIRPLTEPEFHQADAQRADAALQHDGFRVTLPV